MQYFAQQFTFTTRQVENCIASYDKGEQAQQANVFKCQTDAPMFVVPRIHTELACRAFSVAAPSTWNSLPAEIRLGENILTFKRHLKTHLFKLI